MLSRPEPARTLFRIWWATLAHETSLNLMVAALQKNGDFNNFLFANPFRIYIGSKFHAKSGLGVKKEVGLS